MANVEIRRRRKKNKDSYKSYINKVLKQVHPQVRLSNKGMMVLNSFCMDTFEQIASEAGRLVRYSKTQTMSSKDVQAAVRLVLPGELSKHAVSEATKAMTKFSQA